MSDLEFYGSLENVKRNSDVCLINIKRIEWQPNHEELVRYVDKICSFLEENYKKLEQIRRFKSSNHFLRVRDSLNGKDLASLVEKKVDVREPCAIYLLGAELVGFVEEKRDTHPIDFELYVYGDRDC